jgi:two-component system sensor histidine kinase MtrB
MLRPNHPASLLANVQQAWRRSLQVRVVSITLVTGSALVLTFGLVISARITDSLIRTKQESALLTVTKDSEDAWRQLNTIPTPTDGLAPANAAAVLNDLRGRVVGAKVFIVPVPAGSSLLAQGIPAPTTVPAEFVDAVSERKFVYQRLVIDVGEGERLYLAVGRLLQQNWGALHLYYFFPLDAESQLARDFTNIIAVTGIALVIMLALVAYLVTRMVVSPVRVAARTAQRLSNGLLDQRMEVNGEDDLAALAASFNQMAESLQRHILRLEEVSRLQRRFTSDVSHELRTPLTTVRMAADLIYSEREKFEAPVARSAELLVAELDRFESLLAELLEISRFDAGFAALDAEPANLGPMLERVVDRLAAVAERAGVTIELDLPSDPVVAEVDIRRVERILRNLIGNAIEHGEGKPVKVRLAAREAVAITVRDHGVGLRPGEEKLVFSRFWRADPSRARHTGGTGLGLSISLEDAKLHGGWLEAWGAPGQGAQFRLTVPIRAGDRLVSAPLRLVPTDFRPPTEADPEPGAAPRPSPAQRASMPAATAIAKAASAPVKAASAPTKAASAPVKATPDATRVSVRGPKGRTATPVEPAPRDD